MPFFSIDKYDIELCLLYGPNATKKLRSKFSWLQNWRNYVVLKYVKPYGSFIFKF